MSDVYFSKENLDYYLKELAKDYRKNNGKNVPAEIILIGGASVVINYGFREMTYDMDAIINASSSLKDSINTIGDRFGLPNGWMNDDFKRTESYTPKLEQYARYYRTYSNIVTFRTITAEYLIAMKMKSGRRYKYDRSDIIGILWDQEKNGDSLSIERVKKAVEDLYGNYDVVSCEVREFVEQAIKDGGYEEKYSLIRQLEIENKDNLLEYQEIKSDVITEDNVDDIIDALRKRKEKNKS
ncbi:MAG: hypothetical protein K6G26_05120 [Lachnospiraceae bacterium]|nr:hypothetical protein [Lachnospiraceae bacterium]